MNEVNKVTTATSSLLLVVGVAEAEVVGVEVKVVVRIMNDAIKKTNPTTWLGCACALLLPLPSCSCDHDMFFFVCFGFSLVFILI